jgi:hypothetical protein
VGCAPHHGELLKLGIKVSQATVGRWMPWRPKVPSPSWRSFLRNHLPEIAAIDMFVVVTATFQFLYVLIVLNLERRRIVHFEVTRNPTQVWLSGQMTEAFPWDTAPRYLLRDRDTSYGPAFRHRVRAMGIRRSSQPGDRPGKTRTSNVSSVRSVVNAWTTSLSSASACRCSNLHKSRSTGDFSGPAVPSRHGDDSLRDCFDLRLPFLQPRLARA